jgi:threonine dehydrogenase-like Zn-dependent dehydrogenase
VKQLASGRFPLRELATHRYGLGDVDRAIRAVGGQVGEDVVHVSLLPWED